MTDTRDSMVERLAKLRGSLPRQSPGARGLERMARNSKCDRLRVLTLAGVSPAAVAATVYGSERLEERQSPFAIAAGNTFEGQMLRDGAAKLIALLVAAGQLGENPRVVDLAVLFPGRKRQQMELRRERTRELLAQVLEGRAGCPQLIVKPRVRVRIDAIDMEYEVEPDFVVVRSDAEGIAFTVGEIKSYPDRGGKTDPQKVRGACRQAAVGAVALRDALEKGLGVTGADGIVPAAADLVLRVPGTGSGSLRPMTIEGEVDSLRRTLELAPSILDEVEALVPGAGSLDDPGVLEAIPTCYRASCREHCALFPICRRAAAAAGDPAVLGDQARELMTASGPLAQVIPLQRALELSAGDEPRNDDEQRLAARLRTARERYERAVG